ncbi:MAG: hypothetical protein WD118_10770 [Phycisphaeraceae bacterium]
MPDMRIWPGTPYPLGASCDGEGTNFSLFSEAAERVELCLFDGQGHQTAVDLPEVTAYCWHGYLPGIKPGQRYGFRVHGPWAPERGAGFAGGEPTLEAGAEWPAEGRSLAVFLALRPNRLE